jgi:hypothetical protein
MPKSTKVKGNKKVSKKSQDESPKSLGLFDHVKQVKEIQDPDYFKSLTDVDRKTFSHFMILRALSMNPAFCEDVSVFFRFFDKIPPPQFYTLLTSIFPRDRRYWPWIKAKKRHKFSNQLIELLARRFEVSEKEAVDYARILSTAKDGVETLTGICRGYGLNDKEIEKAMSDE